MAGSPSRSPSRSRSPRAHVPEHPSWPPPACPGAGQALWGSLAQVPEQAALAFGEVFAGNGAVHRAVADLGYSVRALDVKYAGDHDVLTPVGLVVLMSTALALVPGGCLWAAPPCSTWIWLSRGSTGRHHNARGDCRRRVVVAQNALVERLVLVLELLTVRGVFWIVEQPRGSVMWKYPAMAALIKRHGLDLVRLDMGAYGARCQKPTELLGTAPYLGSLTRLCTAEERRRLRDEGVRTVHMWTDEDGERRCQGTDQLKSTQAYPEGFGAAHAQAFHEFVKDNLPMGTLPRGACASSGSASANSPRGSSLGRASSSSSALAAEPEPYSGLLPMLLDQLPVDVQQATRQAWWLRDFCGERW